MRILLTSVLALVFCGCNHPKSSDTPDDDDSQDNFVLDTTSDTMSYVGYVHKFDDNESYYTDLYFVDGFDYNRYNEVASMVDEVVFRDDETTRSKIDVQKAGWFFDLTGLGKIDIYNDQNEKLTTGKFSHIEYVDGPIESVFVAVFDVENPSVQNPSFCVGNLTEPLTRIAFETIISDELDLKLLKHLALDTIHGWQVAHYKIDGRCLYSSVSVDTTSFIVETANDQHKILYRSKSSEWITRLNAISNESNGKSILLVQSAVPETDIMWSSVLSFNGKEYEVSKTNRVRVGKQKNNK